MTSIPGATAAPRRFRLQTFGTLRLVHSKDETVLGDHGHHRRRLALLAVLAASGENGLSRDRLQGLFWPEVSQARARHSLDQLLYALRSSLDDDLFLNGNPVRLNAALIDSDVGDFSNALTRRDLETAIALYRGPFLDGFYLSGAPDQFEQWLDAERARVERAYTDALERLAKSFEDANDPSAVAPLLHKLIDIDPVSSKHAISLIRALRNAGDHAAALRYAERYEAIVERELGMGVGPAVAELVAEIRARAKTDSIVVRGGPSRGAARPDRDSPVVPSPVRSAAAASDASIGEADAPAPRIAFWRHLPARYGIALAVLAALAVVGFRIRARASEAASGKTAGPVTRASIAVLPLANHSADPRDSSLADAMTEEIIARLAQGSGLRVIGSTSVFALQKQGIDVRRVADTLHVAQILEGSVQRTGSTLRVQVRLLDARDASTLWSDTYDREFRGVFAVEDDIAGSVVRELNRRIGSAAVVSPRRQPTQNIAAYELYVRGSDRSLVRSDSGARYGLSLFQQAIALDSTYAAAWAGLGRMYVRLGGTVPIPDRGRYHALAEEAARRAISLDDSLAEAHETLGAILTQAFDFDSAERHLRRAIALEPNRPSAMIPLLLWTGRPTEALGNAERALQLDPLSTNAHAELAHALMGNDRCDEALAELEKVSGVIPPLLRVPPMAAQCYARERRWPEAIAVVRRRAERGDPIPLALLGYMLARSGRADEARGIRATLLERWRRGDVGAFPIALVSAGLGERQEACSWLDRSVADRSLTGAGPPADMVMGQMFDEVRRDPCFVPLRVRTGLKRP